MDNHLNNFTTTELHTVSQTLQECFNIDIKVLEADAEIRLLKDDRELTNRPILYWESPVDKSKFIIIKITTDTYKCQFFYRGYQQYSTNIEIYDNIGDCVIDLLQVHSTHQIPDSVLN